MKNIKQLFVILVLLFTGSESALAEYKSLSDVNTKWFDENYTSINECLKSGCEKQIVPIINTLGTIWISRDGAIGFEVFPSMALALSYRTELMLIWFNQHPDEFSKWVENRWYATDSAI